MSESVVMDQMLKVLELKENPFADEAMKSQFMHRLERSIDVLGKHTRDPKIMKAYKIGLSEVKKKVEFVSALKYKPPAEAPKKSTGNFECGHCGQPEENGEMQVCSRCRRVRYCSKSCQVAHWKKGDHKKTCFKPEDCKPDPSEERPAGEKCVICLDLLKSDTTRTLACGHVLHAGCMPTLAKCPLCRRPQAELHGSA